MVEKMYVSLLLGVRALIQWIIFGILLCLAFGIYQKHMMFKYGLSF